jgi:hypothetical protein
MQTLVLPPNKPLKVVKRTYGKILLLSTQIPMCLILTKEDRDSSDVGEIQIFLCSLKILRNTPYSSIYR